MALKRLRNLAELVDAMAAEGEAGPSSAGAGSSSQPVAA